MRGVTLSSGSVAPSSRAARELLTPELLDGLGGLDLVARTIVRGFISGLHRSPFLGSGEDFSRHRAYQQGDDVRRLDWRLYGRTDRLFVRLFREESNLQSFLLVDGTESMAFSGDGPVTKLRYALTLCGNKGADEGLPPPRPRRGPAPMRARSRATGSPRWLIAASSTAAGQPWARTGTRFRRRPPPSAAPTPARKPGGPRGAEPPLARPRR